MKVLCLGVGFTTSFLERSFARSHEFRFLSRGLMEAGAGLSPFVPFDPQEVDFLPQLIVDSVPEAGPGGQPHYFERTEPLVRAGARYVHISSTSVYDQGNSGDPPLYGEDHPANPGTDGGRRRLDLERTVLRSFPEARIVRAGGIYGPGRSVVRSFLNGDYRRLSTTDRLVSRIHVQDLCRLLLALGTAQEPKLVNAVDLHPTWNSELFGWLQREMGVRFPEGFDLRLSRPERARGIRSRHAGQLLAPGHDYPDYRAGFKALGNEGNDSGHQRG